MVAKFNNIYPIKANYSHPHPHPHPHSYFVFNNTPQKNINTYKIKIHIKIYKISKTPKNYQEHIF